MTHCSFFDNYYLYKFIYLQEYFRTSEYLNLGQNTTEIAVGEF